MAGIRYRLAFPQPHAHLMQVEVEVKHGGGALELVLPSWTPGSYLLREYAKQVQDFQACDGENAPLAWEKTGKSTWRVEGAPGTVRARYRVYAHDLTVRTSHLDATHAYVNGASVFVFVRGREREDHGIRVEAPPGWRTTTALPETAPGHFHAADYDQLVDSPLEIGTHEVLEWEQSGRKHRYAIWGKGNYDPERLVADTRRIVQATETLWRGLPYPDYTFILHLTAGGYGGLEHRNSCSLQVDRWAFRGREYEQVQGLVAHEFFHTWNATRIRPFPLERYDYTRENYTRNLWVMEGITTYYTDLLLRRSGLITPDRYLERLGEAIARLQALPGRHVQSLADSSFDTWIKFYRPDENTPNSQISYYQKGALVALLLDLRIRRETENRGSLDDVLHLLWKRYGQEDQGFPEDPAEGIRALAEEVAGVDLKDFFEAYVLGTDELDYGAYLETAGLRLVPTSEPSTIGLAGTEAAPTQVVTPPPIGEGPELGIRIKEEAGRTTITHVLSDTPAQRAGVSPGDELVALNNFRVNSKTLNPRLSELGMGAEAQLTVFRRDQLLTLSVRLDRATPARVRVTRMPERTSEQEAVYRSWMGLAPGVSAAS